MATELPSILTIEEISRSLHIHQRTAYRMAKAGKSWRPEFNYDAEDSARAQIHNMTKSLVAQSLRAVVLVLGFVVLRFCLLDVEVYHALARNRVRGTEMLF
jgi:hypothetical protein